MLIMAQLGVIKTVRWLLTLWLLDHHVGEDVSQGDATRLVAVLILHPSQQPVLLSIT